MKIAADSDGVKSIMTVCDAAVRHAGTVMTRGGLTGMNDGLAIVEIVKTISKSINQRDFPLTPDQQSSTIRE